MVGIQKSPLKFVPIPDKVRYGLWSCGVSFTPLLYTSGLVISSIGLLRTPSGCEDIGFFLYCTRCRSVGRSPFWFSAHFFMSPNIPQLKRVILVAGQSLRFIDPLWYEYFPHPLQGWIFCGVGEVLTSRHCFLRSDLCTLATVVWCCWSGVLNDQSFPDWLAYQTSVAA